MSGVKLVDGLAAVLADLSELTVIVNTADDWEHLGLLISPDGDTVLYTLAGLASEERGWGIEGDTWTALEMLGRYGPPTWFRLSDRDLATHLARESKCQSGNLSRLLCKYSIIDLCHSSPSPIALGAENLDK